MEKARIQFYADAETKRRIKLAAARQGMPINEYCLAAVQQQLAEDEVTEAEGQTSRVYTDVHADGEDHLLVDLRALRHRILTRRGGKLVDLDLISQVRDERDEELTGLY